MLHRTKFLAVAFFAGLATTAFAQNTDETPVVETEQAAPAVDESGLDMGTPVVEESPIGTAYIRETSGDWSIRCLKEREGVEDPCQLYQLLFDDEGNSVAEFSMFPLADGGRAVAGATIVVPLETLLTEQLTLSVDGKAKRRYPLTYCNSAGCVSRVGFTSEEVAQFKRGNAALLRMVHAIAPDADVNLAISLTGFTKAFNSLN